MSATVRVTVDASEGTGGLAARHDDVSWFALQARSDGASTTVTARAALAGLERTWSADFPAGDVDLQMELLRPPAGFVPGAAGGGTVRLLASGGGRDVVLAEFDGRYWSFEVAKSFTGRVLGLYAADGTVSFAELRYRGTDDVPQEISR
jgi:hypothetical protein